MPGHRETAVRLRVQRTKDGVVGDPIVEPADERLEEGQSADGVEQRPLGGRQRAFCQDLPSVWTDGA